MQFFTKSPPVAFVIEGQNYSAPAFRSRQFEEWDAELSARDVNEAAEKIADPDQRARFRNLYVPPKRDIEDLLRLATTVPGAKAISRKLFKAAGVSDEITELAVENTPIDILRTFVDRATLATETLAKLGVDKEQDRADPLPPPPGDAGGVPVTGAASTPASASPIPEPTHVT